ncbi:hypothetical protein C8Q69DRAFT_427101 [Paecilomyces variotii]|uniref:Flavin reductase like domain-containing protein n=1 Tax=Byssochlamys spectabilis TaxID=264951 RepID=A0A443I7N3_BYSSP|nr:hypothetical protein C8Q69DRAFT_427101 [Paecilomyces variotii]RWR00068.1 hypothetical protein C8Q69DRAFT_427101 [Paecilomyces variotii]
MVHAPVTDPIKKYGLAHMAVRDNFKDLELDRPDYRGHGKSIEVTKSPDPHWQYGQGTSDGGASLEKKHREIDPYAEDRHWIANYRLLTSGIVPRSIGVISTISADGKKNLSTFSYFQVIAHDPPMFILGLAARPGRAKDTYYGLKETGECVINTVSEHMAEAASAMSIDAPYDISEWDISGFHEAPSRKVKPSRVKESVFSIEGKVVDIKQFTDPGNPEMSVMSLALIKAANYWIHEDAVNDDATHIDINKLRPVGQLGGLAFATLASTFEIPRVRWDSEQSKESMVSALQKNRVD